MASVILTRDLPISDGILCCINAVFTSVEQEKVISIYQAKGILITFLKKNQVVFFFFLNSLPQGMGCLSGVFKGEMLIITVEQNCQQNIVSSSDKNKHLKRLYYLFLCGHSLLLNK